MKINCPLPFDTLEPADEFTTMAAVREVGLAVERAGFHAGLVTDHPVPTSRWLDAGGHYAQGPFVMLSLLGAVTTTLRLQTGIVVLPYRNPFIVARDLATLDCFTGGRVTLSVGAGYLKGEFRAVGVDFDQRNELMDEYIQALRLALSGEDFTFEGSGYVALGNRILPAPRQKRLPIYGGGNAKRAIRRVVDYCDGWNPFFTAARGNTSTTRTADITDEADLKERIDYMHEYAAQVGRDDMPEVILGGVNVPPEAYSNQEIVDMLGRYEELGVTAAAVIVDGRDRAEFCDRAEEIGQQVIAKLNG
ncbi:TIGR03619 family F420-dependent LLM class oxidoreductase [Novosphingobium pentaromativorans]|nr:TIGR03619 family F420-dependent LLM class oxidoreductase [Novosphingobium pentaromativorans]AIT81440.1 luciferase [Novosphingobium pentaromativorans US6-1]